ncbi:unnamed protein product [Rhizophagus irregularis]|nr:unnamed protein product [Rhizophagus irregularis]
MNLYLFLTHSRIQTILCFDYHAEKLIRDQAPLTLPRTFQDPTMASHILKVTKKHIDMPALVIHCELE